ncbi:MAG: metallophosphoesterase [Chitinophagaceae bacterium]|nr:metallophosphoesterase [Chitinophagaceae bacterium]
MKALIILFLFCNSCFAQSQVWIADSLYSQGTDTIALFPKALNFIVMGDWGRNGADHQREVAVQMGKTANRIQSQFTISTGDNFYPSGVISEWDPLWRYSYEDIYTDFRLQWDWYPVLGNHDYKSNPEAQVKYSQISRRWRMPSRYYSKLFSIPGDTASKVLILFIDTNPFIPKFYSNSEYGPNVKTQDSTRQKKWIEKELSQKDPRIKWKIVVGHHPMYTGSIRTEDYDVQAVRYSLDPLLKKYKVDAYLAGHDHSLQHIQRAEGPHYIISGAASERTWAQLIPGSKMAASAYGFFSFAVLPQTLIIQAIDYEGRVIYRNEIKK